MQLSLVYQAPQQLHPGFLRLRQTQLTLELLSLSCDHAEEEQVWQRGCGRCHVTGQVDLRD